MTPVNATSDPSDKSTPPVSNTNVTPTARMPLMEIWRATLIRLLEAREFGFAIPSTVTIKASARTSPNRFSQPPTTVVSEAEVSGSGGHGMLQDVLLRGMGCVEFCGKRALPHHQDAVAQRH